MPSSCCVAKCNKIKGRDDSSVRDFLIFHNFPLKTKNKALIEKWTLRVGRPQGDVNSKSMHVCSDHFCEEDYVPETLTKYRLNPGLFGTATIKLKPDATPNTDRTTNSYTIRPATNPLVNQETSDAARAILDWTSSAREIASNSSTFAEREEPERKKRKNVSLAHINRLIDSNTSLITSTTEAPLEEPAVFPLEPSVLPIPESNAELPDHLRKNRATQTGISYLPLSNDHTAMKTDYEDGDQELGPNEMNDLDYDLPSSQHQPQEKGFIQDHEWVLVNINELSCLFEHCLECGGRLEKTTSRYTGMLV